MTYSFCTVTDSKYLHFGISLYKSIQKYSNNFTLYYLCTDQECYDKLCELNFKNIIPISLEDLENGDPELLRAKNQQPSDEAKTQERYWQSTDNKKNAQWMQYFWALSSYFSWHVLKTYQTDHILYVDSDIYFFNDWKAVFTETDNRSIGLVSHRLSEWSETRIWGEDWESTTEKGTIPHSGFFNVGIVYFKNNDVGLKCVETWKNWLLNPSNKYHKDYGNIGDQRYLMLFIPLFGRENVAVLENLGHLAPWNVQNHGYGNDKITWQGEEQTLTYYHFSNFAADFENDNYAPAPRHGNAHGMLNGNEYLRNLHDKYFQSLKESKAILGW